MMADSNPALHSVSVAAVITDAAHRVLAVQRRDNGHWEPPGGVLEVHETIEDGLVREVLEETGLIVQPLTHTGVYKHVNRGIVALVFRCRAVGVGACISSETLAMRWMTRAEVVEHMDEVFGVRVLDALDDQPRESGPPPQVRNHNGLELLAS